ncbi:MAG: DUF4136 domain-containing protein [Cyclobacteriaceae bacterium]|nr:DUF4136 domain-containing protein [Cyclobacteriaceae bacterium]
MLKKLIAFALVAPMVWGCYPAGPEYYEDMDVVATRLVDNEFNFTGTNKKYAMPDEIVTLDGGVVDGGGPSYLPDAAATPIINRIVSNMTSYGWTRTDNLEEADVVILPAVWTNTFTFYWYDYWCWYYYYYCGWGWGYPVSTSYTSGTLLMAMVYNQKVGGDPLPYRVWTGAVNGLLSGAYNVNRVNNGVDQAFRQSPYLKVN